jgi:hypothetical protein
VKSGVVAALIGALAAGCAIDLPESLGRDRAAAEAGPIDAYVADVPEISDAGAIAVEETPGDAGDPDAELVGCNQTTSSSDDAGDADAASNAIECTANVTASGLNAILIDGGIADSLAGKLPGKILAGHAYAFSYKRTLPLSLGQPVTVNVYGSNPPDVCAQGEKLFTMILDSSLDSRNKVYCFTPGRDYAYAVPDISVSGVFF